MAHLTRRRSALCIALTAVVAVASSSCSRQAPDAAWWQGEAERAELSQSFELKSFRFEQESSIDLAELQKFQQSSAILDEMLERLRARNRELNREVNDLVSDRESFHMSLITKQRQRAIGTKFASFYTASGRSYENVTVAAVDDAGVTLRHDSGSAKVRYADLSASQQQFFALEEDLARAAQLTETQETTAYERWIDQQMVHVKAKEEKAAELARMETRERDRARSASVASRSQISASVRPLAQPAKSFSSRPWSGYRNYSYYRTRYPTYRYVHYTPGSYASSHSRHLGAFRQGYGNCYLHIKQTTSQKSFATTKLLSIP